MAFLTDKQTLDDLNIFGRHGSDSIYNIFNRCSTRGGALVLEDIFRYPLSDAEAINRRSGIIQYFSSSDLRFPFRSTIFDEVQIYLSNTDERSKLVAQDNTLGKRLSNALAIDLVTAQIHKGIAAIMELVKETHQFINSLQLKVGSAYEKEMGEIASLLTDPMFIDLLESPPRLSHTAMVQFDELLRFRNRQVAARLLNYIYQLDVYIAVGSVARERKFNFPVALAREARSTNIVGVYHPQLEHAVSNTIRITPKGNVIFLTGANMAGKSTFMKSLSIAVYLAHMGFPVAAAKMEFSVLDGIYTTINLPDDLGMGASHFYAEVLRAKKVANEVRTKSLFVVFDELFRGTNVKDAAEATIAFTEAFSRKIDSVFIISTHIMEAGTVLKQHCKNINFIYLPTLMKGTQPVYTYKLEQGITEDRHGMVIINNEGILKILTDGRTIESKSANFDDQKKDEFRVDKQTLADLNLLDKYKPNSVYSLFNKVQTAGGERLLQEMFNHPLTEAEQINERSSLFNYFGGLKLSFPVNREIFVVAENYLDTSTSASYLSSTSGLLVKKVQGSFLRDEQYPLLYNGLLAAIEMLNAFGDFIAKLAAADQNTGPYTQELSMLLAVFADPRLKWLTVEKNVQELSFLKVAGYDYLLKHTLRRQMEMVLESLYRLDVYLIVSQTAKRRGFSYAKAMPAVDSVMQIEDLSHPSLVNSIANTINLHPEENLIFLTGANMAGKSTLMKAFGIAVYLAHMGFPVAARDMQFSVMDGLYSSINVTDNLNMGYSHFYAEVLRVKKVAEEVAAGRNMVILFDELFKGTNVKDAYDGTLAVTRAFSEYRNCFFIISTHIIEVGQSLQSSTSNLRFAYLPTYMNGNVPQYTYQLEEGITADKQGMTIIQNEGILDMLA